MEKEWPFPSLTKCTSSKRNQLFQFIEHQTQQRKEVESLFTWTGCYLFEHENGNDCCLKLDASKSSINLWSDTLALAAAKRWYSSNTEVRHHFCNFLKHPTRQPVRCWKMDTKKKHNLNKILFTLEFEATT